MSSLTFSSLKGHYCTSPLRPTLCLFLLTSVAYSSKWAWHASHYKGIVCGWCLGRWDLLWDTLISSKPRPGQGGTGQVSGTTRYPPHWLLLSVRVKSAPSFMAQSLLHPGVPNHLASIPGPFLGAPEGGNSEQLLYHGGFLNAPSATPVCFNLFF